MLPGGRVPGGSGQGAAPRNLLAPVGSWPGSAGGAPCLGVGLDGARGRWGSFEPPQGVRAAGLGLAELCNAVVPLCGIGAPNGGAGGASRLLPPLKGGFVPCGPSAAFPEHVASFVWTGRGVLQGCTGRGLQQTLCRWGQASPQVVGRAPLHHPPRSSALKPPLHPPGHARERPEAAGAVPSRHLHGSLPARVTLGLAAPAASLPAASLPALLRSSPRLLGVDPQTAPLGFWCRPRLALTAGLAMGLCSLLIAAHLPRERDSLAALAASHPRVGLAGRGRPCWRA